MVFGGTGLYRTDINIIDSNFNWISRPKIQQYAFCPRNIFQMFDMPFFLKGLCLSKAMFVGHIFAMMLIFENTKIDGERNSMQSGGRISSWALI